MNDCNSLDFKKDGIRMTPYYINRHHEISLLRAILEKIPPKTPYTKWPKEGFGLSIGVVI